MTEYIHIAIVDDEELFRKGITMLIEDMEGIKVTMTASHGQEFLDTLKDSPSLPHVVLLDLNMPHKNGIDTSKILKRDYPKMNIIILSSHFSKSFVLHMLEIGVSAYLSKDTAHTNFEITIRSVFEKGFYHSPEVQQIIQDSFKDKRANKMKSKGIHLTKRELEILNLICNQYTNQEIANQLYLSPRTIEGHRNNIISKTNCRNTAGIVAYAIQHNLATILPQSKF